MLIKILDDHKLRGCTRIRAGESRWPVGANNYSPLRRHVICHDNFRPTPAHLTACDDDTGCIPVLPIPAGLRPAMTDRHGADGMECFGEKQRCECNRLQRRTRQSVRTAGIGSTRRHLVSPAQAARPAGERHDREWRGWTRKRAAMVWQP